MIYPRNMAGTAPFVSVIIPAYNAAEIIDGALNAVLNQTHPKDKFEVIVMNDGSSDKTCKVASQYQVTVISHSSNLGPGLLENALACALPNPKDRAKESFSKFSSRFSLSIQNLAPIFTSLVFPLLFQIAFLNSRYP